MACKTLNIIHTTSDQYATQCTDENILFFKALFHKHRNSATAFGNSRYLRATADNFTNNFKNAISTKPSLYAIRNIRNFNRNNSPEPFSSVRRKLTSETHSPETTVICHEFTSGILSKHIKTFCSPKPRKPNYSIDPDY